MTKRVDIRNLRPYFTYSTYFWIFLSTFSWAVGQFGRLASEPRPSTRDALIRLPMWGLTA
jgi:hypothetical protein